MRRVLKKITVLLTIVLCLISCTIRYAKPITLCDELTEGLTTEEIYATLTDEQLNECGYESGFWSTHNKPINTNKDYSYLYKGEE